MKNRSKPYLSAVIPSGKRPEIAYPRAFAIVVKPHAHGDSEHQLRQAFESYGFRPKYGMFFLEDPAASPVTCIIAAQRMVRENPWIKDAIHELRMLRVDASFDLAPALTAP